MKTLLRFLFLFSCPLLLTAQQSISLKIANMEQDMYQLKTMLGQLKLEVEQVKRDNLQLKKQVEVAKQAGEMQYVTLNHLNTELDQLHQSIARGDKTVGANTAVQLEKLAAQTKKAIEAIANSIEAGPSVSKVITFSNDYPTEGVAYTVRGGDTLSGIAKKHGAKMKDIQNANKIADPTKIQVGQKLFIPQGN